MQCGVISSSSVTVQTPGKKKKKNNWHPQPSWQPYNRWWPTTPRLYLCISPSAGCSAQLQFAFQTLIVPLRIQPYKMALRSHLNKKKVQIHTFDSGLFLRQKREWKFPSVKLPPAIRPLISGVIFSFCFFFLMWRKILFNNRFRSYYPTISDCLVSVGGGDLNRKR